MMLIHSLGLLTLSLSSVALANSPFYYLAGSHLSDALSKRQTTFCGTGNTCAEACGAGYEQCGPNFGHCYNPSAGDTCCGTTGKYCPAGEFCAPVEGYCCYNGQDPATCAASQGFTIPLSTASSVYVTSSTPAPVVVVTTSSYVAPTFSYSPTTTSSVAIATFTGAAAKMDFKKVGKVVAAVAGLAVGL